VKNFITEEECRHIQETASPKMKYSKVVLTDSEHGRKNADFRTSQTAFLLPEQSDVVVEVDERTAILTRIPVNHQEHTQVLRYGRGGRFLAHNDYFDPEVYSKDQLTLSIIDHGRRNRHVTVFWYLSDVEAGGHTAFPRKNGRPMPRGEEAECSGGLKVKPEMGKVIIFYSLTADGRMDPLSIHAACSVKEGIKWAANKWIWNVPMTFMDRWRDSFSYFS